MRFQIVLIIIVSLGMNSCLQKDNENNSKKALKTDSTTIKKEHVGFDPDGYYIPTDTIEYKNLRIDDILFSTSNEKDELGNNKINYVELECYDKAKNVFENVKAKKIIIRDKTVFMTFESQIGKISFNGQFLGKHGPAYDNVKNNPDIMVMSGTFSINKNFKKETKFSYYSGD